MRKCKEIAIYQLFQVNVLLILGQSLFDLLCQFVVVQSPLLGKLLDFFLGQVNHGSMLRLGEVGGEHHAVNYIKMKPASSVNETGFAIG